MDIKQISITTSQKLHAHKKKRNVTPGRLAVMDIGSNAIRAVVYQDHSLGAEEIYNEKFRSDLNSLLDSDVIDIKHQVYLILQYFCHIFSQLEVTDIKCVATAVLRNRSNADEFCQLVKNRYNLDIVVLSGAEEAYLTASGLSLGIPEANGVIADLGGGSLELAEIINSEIDNLASYPLGTKILDRDALTEEKIIEVIKQRLPTRTQHSNLYLIGGGFRILGRKYIEISKYPLKNLHNLAINQQELMEFLTQVEKQPTTSLYGSVRKLNPNAITLLKSLVSIFDPQKLIVSNYGLKEGVRYMCIDKSEKKHNIILARALSLTNTPSSKIDSLVAYRSLIEPLMIEPTPCALQAIELSIIFITHFRNIDRTLIANFASEYIMVSDIPFSHKQRVMIALVLAQFFAQKEGLFIINLAKKILNKADYMNCQIIASALAVASKVDGPEFIQPSFKFAIKNDFIELNANFILPKHIFNKACYYIKSIASARHHALRASKNK